MINSLIDRKRDRQTDRQIDTHKEKQVHRQTDTDRGKHFLHVNFYRKMNSWNHTSIKSNCHIAHIAVVLS